MALSRLPSTKRNLKKNSRVADEYQATIQAYVEKEYLRKAPYGVALWSMFRRRTLEETKTAIPLPLRPSLSQPSWTILLTVLKTMRKAIEAIPTEERTKEIVMNSGQQAYGAAVYMHCEYDNGTVTSCLIPAMCKVASLTPMTVPRLELMGAILGLRLTQSLLMVLEAPMQS
ncbi:hypothetical protein pdam_00025846, partial [Pocillopora damicornis]